MDSLFESALTTQLAAINALVAPTFNEADVRGNAAPPKMIVFPLNDTFDAPDGPGGPIRALKDALENRMVVIQGRTRDEVRGMRDQFVIALHHACKKSRNANAGDPHAVRAGRYVLGRGEWTRNTLKAVNGFEYRLTFSVQVPVVDRVWQRVDETDEVPEGVPQAPVASTYTPDQSLTNELATAETIGVSVGLGDEDEAAEPDDVTINVPPPAP